MSASIPLTSAVTSGDEKAVSASLANGADANERASGGRTALILAVIHGHTNLVRLLVEAGANPHQRDDLGLNAIDWAQRRGSTEALQILNSAPRTSSPPRRITINLEEPAKPAPPAVETGEASDAEKSRRWIAGVKQRLDEQELRRSSRNEPLPQPVLPEPELVTPEPALELEPLKPEVTPVHSSRILTPPAPPVEPVKRKRCPQCNAVYNGDLLTYCSHHIVPLVDFEEPVSPEPPPPQPNSNPPLFWAMVIGTLVGSIVLGSLITAYIYKNQATARTAAQPPKLVQKGLPEVSGDLAGKAVSLPEAECPLRGFEAISGTVTVQVTVDKNGQVTKARGSGADWLMRGAATEAAMKSTFDREKLRGRETEGTITYTFKP